MYRPAGGFEVGILLRWLIGWVGGLHGVGWGGVKSSMNAYACLLYMLYLLDIR